MPSLGTACESKEEEVLGGQEAEREVLRRPLPRDERDRSDDELEEVSTEAMGDRGIATTRFLTA